MKLLHTPVELYEYDGILYHVKREDLCIKPPAPPFSKMRGLIEEVKRLKEKGIKYVGYSENNTSMAGWGVCYACHEMGLTPVIYDPQYKNETPATLIYHREQWKQFNPIIHEIKAGIQNINFNIAKRHMKEEYGDKGEILPIGLPFENAIYANEKEARWTIENHSSVYRTIVVCIGSGIITSGLVRAFESKTIFGIMCSNGDIKKMRKKIESKSKKLIGGMFGVDLRIVNPGWGYTEIAHIETEFPCHRTYDKKAFMWMIDNIHRLYPPILFWNIGAMPEEIDI